MIDDSAQYLVEWQKKSGNINFSDEIFTWENKIKKLMVHNLIKRAINV